VADPILKGPAVYLPFLVHGLGRSGQPLEVALRIQASLLHRPRLQMALRNRAGLRRDDTYGDLLVQAQGVNGPLESCVGVGTWV